MLYILFISIGLAMDSFSVSIAIGSYLGKRNSIHTGITSSMLFGLFQGLMPIIGTVIGKTFKTLISGIDHWIAFSLLFYVGVKMIHGDLNERLILRDKEMSIRLMISLAIATSIDALIVGMGMVFMDISIFQSVTIIMFVTFVLSLTGIYIGIKSNHAFGQKSQMVGGLILMAIAVKILADHLLL